MATDKRPTHSKNKSISIHGDVRDSTVIIGDDNTVNKTTIIQKFFSIFKSDSETLEHRNRRILLNHVENAWIKGVLDASLHGAALLDLGIKQDSEAVTQYPWAIRQESTKGTLPAGLSMLEIFDSIGMGRSLLILGAPGSGKTTMLLELARGLIARAREDITQPIPMVFNLASWTEKLTLADWLAQELNNLYSVPRKTAPDWVKGNKLLLLLDGLDEVRQDSRAKCVEAINEFRKQNGLTSLAVCSRSQDYADLKAKLSFEGAIEVQSLTQEQITEFFNRFGKEMVGIKQILKKDSALREMAETPLFLSIMIMAYRDKQDVDILTSKDEKAQRKHLFDTYIERMFEHPHSKKSSVKKQDVLHWLSWLGSRMIAHNQIPYEIENMQPDWFPQQKRLKNYRLIFGLLVGLSVVGRIFKMSGSPIAGEIRISMVDSLSFNWEKARRTLIVRLIAGLLFGPLLGLFSGLFVGLSEGLNFGLLVGLSGGLLVGLSSGLIGGLIEGQVDQTTYPGQRLFFSAKNLLVVGLVEGLIVGLIVGPIVGLFVGLSEGPIVGLVYGLIGGGFVGLIFGLIGGLLYGGNALIQHFTLRFILSRNNLLPWRLVPFLDHCVDLIFLRRVGGGYIFIHRLLMEHFADMYEESV